VIVENTNKINLQSIPRGVGRLDTGLLLGWPVHGADGELVWFISLAYQRPIGTRYLGTGRSGCGLVLCSYLTDAHLILASRHLP